MCVYIYIYIYNNNNLYNITCIHICIHIYIALGFLTCGRAPVLPLRKRDHRIGACVEAPGSEENVRLENYDT